MKRKWWDREDERYILENALILTDEQMADELRRSPKAVKRKRQQLSIFRPRGRAYKKLNDVQVMQITRMMEEGLTHREMAKQMDICVSTMYKMLKDICEDVGITSYKMHGMNMVLPRWYRGSGTHVRTAHEHVDGIVGPIAKLEALTERRRQIVEAMARHADQPQLSTHNPHEREWQKMHEAYRDVWVAIDTIGRGAWPVTDGQA